MLVYQKNRHISPAWSYARGATHVELRMQSDARGVMLVELRIWSYTHRATHVVLCRGQVPGEAEGGAQRLHSRDMGGGDVTASSASTQSC